MFPMILYSVYRTPGGDRWCPAKPQERTSYQCKPAIKCSPWFIELLYNPWWCLAGDGSFGACCPDVNRPTCEFTIYFLLPFSHDLVLYIFACSVHQLLWLVFPNRVNSRQCHERSRLTKCHESLKLLVSMLKM